MSGRVLEKSRGRGRFRIPFPQLTNYFCLRCRADPPEAAQENRCRRQGHLCISDLRFPWNEYFRGTCNTRDRIRLRFSPRWVRPGLARAAGYGAEKPESIRVAMG